VLSPVACRLAALNCAFAGMHCRRFKATGAAPLQTACAIPRAPQPCLFLLAAGLLRRKRSSQ